MSSQLLALLYFIMRLGILRIKTAMIWTVTSLKNKKDDNAMNF